MERTVGIRGARQRMERVDERDAKYLRSKIYLRRCESWVGKS